MDHKQVITRQQYLEALELIDMYHRQTSERDVEDHGKTKMIDWINSLDKMPSTRLCNLLMRFDYFEDVTKSNFLTLRNCGIASWIEFCKLADIKHLK